MKEKREKNINIYVRLAKLSKKKINNKKTLREQRNIILIIKFPDFIHCKSPYKSDHCE